MKTLRLVIVPFLPSLVLAFANLKDPSKPSTSTKSRLHATSDSQSRQPWELGRFIQQSSKFVSPFGNAATTVKPGDVLWEPSSRVPFGFGPLDDVVMGGVSSSTFDNASGKWTGTVTDANNGGFVGIRSFPSLAIDMSACKGIELQLAGGAGKRYKVSVRDSADFNGIVWAKSVEIGNSNPAMKLFQQQEDAKPQTIRIPLNQFRATRFAKTIPRQVLRKDRIVGFQLTYSKFEYDGNLNPNFELGPVDVQVQAIRAY
mmetsp:Transcript_24320/g.56670  ORF Transcript_24320/g.56670 Transcript_24320/m.56670 type:complete len:258 (-) Transcript_24320:76-849(-)